MFIEKNHHLHPHRCSGLKCCDKEEKSWQTPIESGVFIRQSRKRRRRPPECQPDKCHSGGTRSGRLNSRSI